MTPLVLVHGFMGGSQQWQVQRKELEQEFRIIAPDLPGFGANAHLPPLDTIGAYADWVLDQLSADGIDRFHLLGHSMGGMVVQEMIHRAPDRVDALVLYGTGANGVLPGRFETIEASKSRAVADGAPRTARRIAATWFLAQDRAEAYEACADIAQQSRLPAVHAGLDAMYAWSGSDNLANIRSRSLVIWGDQDRTYPWSQVEQLWSSIDGCHLSVIPGCAHAVHMEKPAIFNAILLDFLRQPSTGPTRPASRTVEADKPYNKMSMGSVS
ncbi:alpha/beta hydrolase [Marivita sp. S6314]|uniref:alpha/beta fold hydrolase n=1 Tax=Marivita sp. S6314 TaxID=2926406 RepID=UPI001FF21D30|nr:alpha/beta hydrolase [Marivita sp. S6314]MCK0150504.1 alpha/beta hydrolase [Marivita sp. S6314]